MKTFNTLIVLLFILIISSCGEDDPVTPTQSGIPSKPKNLTPKYEDSIVVLKWETPENTGNPIITKYLIYRKSVSSNFENIGFTFYNITTYQDSSALLLNNYNYYVTAINTDGESERSNEITARAYPFGTNLEIWSVAIIGNDVYAGGLFTTAGGINTNRIAKWHSSSWSTLGSGLNNGVTSIAVSGNDVYAGGFFTTAGGIAKWNGSSWSALGSGLNGGVFSIAVSGNDVYAGGGFLTAGGGTARRIAKWNGSEWSGF